MSAAGALVDRIKVNSLIREMRDGRTFWIKRRRKGALRILACANRFFPLVGNPVLALSETQQWQQWEVTSFLNLHGEVFQSFAEGAHAVAAEEVPGRNLSDHLRDGSLSASMLSAAAREMRRAHAILCPTFGARWSHGDPHAGNFVYDAATDRARLIDFEVMHDQRMSADERHADDLLVFLQDLLGRIPASQWLPSAHTFLIAYARPEVIARLREKLIAPHGAARIWWAIRTTYLAPHELRRRIDALRESL